jgi:electron transfer flavoprotein alpha subunit
VQGGSHRLVHHLPTGRPVVVLAKPTSSQSIESRPGTTELVNLQVDTSSSRVRRTSDAGSGTNGVSLAAARRIISIGRGIGGPDRVPLYRELAERLGAALGASRVAVDSGWIPFAHQVGQTGAAVAPELYVAFGISGAAQHLAGMRASKHVVAVNTDVEAPICRVADVVIKADANRVAEALLKKAAEAGL